MKRSTWAPRSSKLGLQLEGVLQHAEVHHAADDPRGIGERLGLGLSQI